MILQHKSRQMKMKMKPLPTKATPEKNNHSLLVRAVIRVECSKEEQCLAYSGNSWEVFSGVQWLPKMKQEFVFDWADDNKKDTHWVGLWVPGGENYETVRFKFVGGLFNSCWCVGGYQCDREPTVIIFIFYTINLKKKRILKKIRVFFCFKHIFLPYWL